MNRKITAYLQGGLGNQCFIYATARALALKANAGLVIDCDYLNEDYVYKRKLALGQFNCELNLSNTSCKIVRVLKLLRYKLLRDRAVRIGNLCIDKRPYKFRLLPTDFRGTLTLDGYWQSEKYFVEAREQLLKDFELKDKAWVAEDEVARQIKEAGDKSVFLHVRSYKEVPGKSDGSCALAMIEYYRKAIKLIRDQVKGAQVFVFSDDLKWAKKNVVEVAAGNAESFFYVNSSQERNSQIRDFTLMRICAHGIVADSSFSWWAGWLGEQERLLNGESAIRIRPNRRVMNDDFWPGRWLCV